MFSWYYLNASFAFQMLMLDRQLNLIIRLLEFKPNSWLLGLFCVLLAFSKIIILLRISLLRTLGSYIQLSISIVIHILCRFSLVYFELAVF